MLGCEGGQARRRWGALWSPSTNYKRPIFGESLSGADWGGLYFPPSLFNFCNESQAQCVLNAGAE